MHFENTEENKLIYMDIFKKYTDSIEKYIEKRLAEEIPGFKMEVFGQQLKKRKDEIDEQIMDLLLSFSDFAAFKEMMLMNRAYVVATTPKLKSSKAAALGLKDKMGTDGKPKEGVKKEGEIDM